MMAMPSRVNSSPYRRLDPCWSPWKVEIVLGLLLQELGFFKRKKSESWRFEVISCTNSELLATFDVALPWTSDQALRKTKRRPCLPCRPREKLKNVPPLRLKTPLSLKVRTWAANTELKISYHRNWHEQTQSLAKICLVTCSVWDIFLCRKQPRATDAISLLTRWIK